MPSLHVVTGAFGYSGQYIARRLLDAGHTVRTLTNSLKRESPLQGEVQAFPFNFDNPDALRKSLEGVEVLYNTYWVRFGEDNAHEQAVRNSAILFDAARDAGVQRIVHVSIANPSEDSLLSYYKGKALVEKHLIGTGVPYGILRPTVLFGREDILINNIAWMLRHLPVFFLFGRGEYPIQPIYVEDQARLAVSLGESRENVIVNAVGPETFAFRDLVRFIADELHFKRLILPMAPSINLLAGKIMGALKNDLVISREEVKGLMQGLLAVDTPPTGDTKLTDWIRENRDTLGKRYANELARRRNRTRSYGNL